MMQAVMLQTRNVSMDASSLGRFLSFDAAIMRLACALKLSRILAPNKRQYSGPERLAECLNCCGFFADAEQLRVRRFFGI